MTLFSKMTLAACAGCAVANSSYTAQLRRRLQGQGLPPAAVNNAATGLAGTPAANNLAPNEYLQAVFNKDPSLEAMYKNLPPAAKEDLQNTITVRDAEVLFNKYANAHDMQIGTVNAKPKYFEDIFLDQHDPTGKYEELFNSDAMSRAMKEQLQECNSRVEVDQVLAHYAQEQSEHPTNMGAFGNAHAGRFVNGDDGFGDLFDNIPTLQYQPDGTLPPPAAQGPPSAAVRPPVSDAPLGQPAAVDAATTADTGMPEIDFSELSNLGLSQTNIEALDLPDGLLSTMDQTNILDIMGRLDFHGTDMAETYNQAMSNITKALENVNDAVDFDQIGDAIVGGFGP